MHRRALLPRRSGPGESALRHRHRHRCDLRARPGVPDDASDAGERAAGRAHAADHLQLRVERQRLARGNSPIAEQKVLQPLVVGTKFGWNIRLALAGTRRTFEEELSRLAGLQRKPQKLTDGLQGRHRTRRKRRSCQLQSVSKSSLSFDFFLAC